MSKEEYLEMLYQKLNIPRQLLIKYIHSVGTNEENIKDYAMNASCAVVRKDNGFQIDYTAEMINNKDQKIDQLKQQLEIQSSVLKQTREKLSKAEHDRDRYRDKIKEQQEQLAKKENMHPLDEKLFQHYCAYKHIEPEIKGCLDRDREREYIKQLTEKQKTIDEINKEFVQSVHDWKALCAEKDKEIEKLKQQYTILENENGKLAKELIVKNYKKAQKEVSFGIQLAIQELEKVNGILTDTIIEITQDEFDLNKLCYLEEISAKFYEKIQQQIKELKGE